MNSQQATYLLAGLMGLLGFHFLGIAARGAVGKHPGYPLSTFFEFLMSPMMASGGILIIFAVILAT